MFAHSKGHLAMPRDILIVPAGVGILLASNLCGPGSLLNNLQCAGQSPPNEALSRPIMSTVPRLRNLVLEEICRVAGRNTKFAPILLC